jgi:hypothetical protein
MKNFNYKMYWENVGHVKRTTIPDEYRCSKDYREASRISMEALNTDVQCLVFCRTLLKELDHFEANCTIQFKKSEPQVDALNWTHHWDFHWAKLIFPGPRPQLSPGIQFARWNTMSLRNVSNFAEVLNQVYIFGLNYFDRGEA